MAFNLTLNSATWDTSTQKFGTGAINGGNGQAATGVIPSYPFTVEAWVKAASGPASILSPFGMQGLFAIATPGSSSTHLRAYNGSGPIDCTFVLCDGAWHHIAVVCASTSSMVVYADGAQVISTSSGGAFGAQTLGVNSSSGQTLQWLGEVDEVAVWNTAKYTSGFTPPTSAYTGSETGLVALYHLDSNGTDSANPSSPTISQPTVTGLTVGGQTAISGAFTNGAATGLTYSLDAGGAVTASSPSIRTTSGSGSTAAGTYLFYITTPTAGAHTLTVTETGITSPATSVASASFTTAAGVVIAPNNAALIYSPWNWVTSSTSAKTNCAGAYFRTIFTGASCVLTFNVSINGTPLSEILVRVDGQAWQQFNVDSTITVTMPTGTTSWPHHVLDVVIKSTSNFLNSGIYQGGSRWSPQNTAVVLTGINLAASAVVSAPSVPGRSVAILGDSITEGYKTFANNGTGTNDCDGSDATLGWAFEQRRLLGAEVGVIGFGGAAVTAGGQLGVPSLLTSYALQWSGQSRTFTTVDLIVIAYGENDGTSTGDATFISNYKTVVNALLAATPGTTKIACMVPFSQHKAVDIATAISQIGSQRVTKIDTTGMFSTTDSYDGQHPLGIANLGAIAPQVANKLRPILTGITNRWVHS